MEPEYNGEPPPPLPDAPPPLPPQEQRPLVRCEVTGRMVAPEDAVEFRGKTVSAEGKEILLRQLMDGGAAPGVLTHPGFLRRVLCYLLDCVVLTIFGLPLTIYNLSQGMDTSTGAMPVFLQGLAVLCTFLYPALMHGAYGKTLGKMAGRCRVVNMDGTPVTYGTAAARAFWSNAVLGIPAVVYLFSPGIGLVLNVMTGLYGLINGIVLLVDGDMNRALHDRFAGTRVVMDPPRQ